MTRRPASCSARQTSSVGRGLLRRAGLSIWRRVRPRPWPSGCRSPASLRARKSPLADRRRYPATAATHTACSDRTGRRSPGCGTRCEAVALRLEYDPGMARPPPDPLAIVLDYHERTKHHPHRYAAGPGYLDWASQPDPFRRFIGAELLPLDRIEPGPESAGGEIDRAAAPQRRLDRAAVSQLFFDSLALSAWKEAGTSRWSLRVNPSSGNLHPTEGYLLA